MPLEMRKTSHWWYGRYNVGRKVYCVNLRVRIEGDRPESIRQDGDRIFERSRGKAMGKFESMVRKAKDRQDSAEYIQKLHEIRTGRRIDSIPIAELTAEWDKASRKRTGAPQYIKEAHSLFARFVVFVQKHYKDAETLADVTSTMAEAFMVGERDRGVSGRTFNAALILLRSAFKVLAQKANIARNPFSGILTANEETIHRKPFTQEELQAILKAADEDPFIRPVIVTGICTAMRRGDCCLLRWEDVDLKERFVRVKTAKTGETVEIPMFPILCDELHKQSQQKTGFVFPEQARVYQKNAHGISSRVKQVLESAGFFDEEEKKDVKEKKDGKKTKPDVLDPRPLLPAAELLDAGLRVLAELPEGAMDPTKRERMKEVFKTYVSGTSLPKIARKMGISKSSVSEYLHEMDSRTGLRVLRATRKKRPAKPRGEVSAARKGGLRRASVRNFHSFRVTWITLALTAGVPMELVTRVTGHQTVDVVLKHYFRPGREDFRQAIEGAMPRLLMESNQPSVEAKSPGEMLTDALNALDIMTAKTWQKQRDAAVLLVRQAKEQLAGRVVQAGVSAA